MEDISICQHYYEHNSNLFNQTSATYHSHHPGDGQIERGCFNNASYKNTTTSLTISRISWLPRLFSFQKLSAEANNEGPPPPVEEDQSHDHQLSSSSSLLSSPLEPFARAYIDKETGWERINIIFKKDHQFNHSVEFNFMKVAIIQTFSLSFIMGYIPTWFTERRKFIAEHRGTVFRTRTQALKLLYDTIFHKSLLAGGKFALKITAFSAGMIVVSQLLSAYRNKTSALDYAAAGGMTGALARLSLGPRGLVAGSIFGGTLGGVVGLLIVMLFRSTGFTQEERHLIAVIDMLEMERSIVGQEEFERKMTTLMKSPERVEMMANKLIQ